MTGGCPSRPERQHGRQGGFLGRLGLGAGGGVSCLEEAVRTGEGLQEGRSLGEEDCLPSARPSVRWGSALGSPRVDDRGARVWGSVTGDPTWGDGGCHMGSLVLFSCGTSWSLTHDHAMRSFFREAVSAARGPGPHSSPPPLAFAELTETQAGGRWALDSLQPTDKELEIQTDWNLGGRLGDQERPGSV